MILSFELSMPGICSWNGKWSGEGKMYAIVKSFIGKEKENLAKEILDKEHFEYNFGDGWIARIKVNKVDRVKAGMIKRKSQGFCGYDWMVESIVNNLKIDNI